MIALCTNVLPKGLKLYLSGYEPRLRLGGLEHITEK